MVGKTKADNSGDIYVEFDYDNIILVDPNKVIDKDGRISERLVDHENLVMYANLECDVLPRTKLAVGGISQDKIQTISVAKMNFLKPTKDTFLGTGYYDDLTGKDSSKSKGRNQSVERIDSSSKEKIYRKNTVVNEQNVQDTGLLGITNIEITTNSAFVPSVTITMEDVQGKALFQLGDNSPYAAFFHLPYPQFYLTLKGYYGQAVRYQLNLEKFNSSFNSFSGNYTIKLEFRGYKFNVLGEIMMSHLLATPHMFGQTFSFTSNPEILQISDTTTRISANIENTVASEASNNPNNIVTQIISERGYQKIKEVYSDYKSKGLVPIDLPELTLVQLMNKLENFENFIVNSYPKANLEPLTNIREYKNILKEYYNQIRLSSNSWFNKFLNPNPIILKNKEKVFVYRENVDDETMDRAMNELQNLIKNYNSQLDDNPTLGGKSKYRIQNTINLDTFLYSNTSSTVDWAETTRFQTGVLDPTTDQIIRVESYYSNLRRKEVVDSQSGGKILVQPPMFVFEGTNRFNRIITSMETLANKKLSEFETKISADLAKRLEDSSIGLGFKPTIRNMIGVIMASAEAFVRLMDETHTKAWAQKTNPTRKRVILNNPSSAPGSDTKDYYGLTNESQESNQGLTTGEIPVYPWPQFFVESYEDKRERFQLKYLGDPSVVDVTSGFLYEVWPEVEFVEEYIKGLTQKFNPPTAPPILDNQQQTVEININAIEFPHTAISYLNKEEIRFFYEIWERQFLSAHYTNLVRGINQFDKLIEITVETEASNIKESLGASSPYITSKLKNFGFNSSNYQDFLQNISNGGTGRAYQDYIRDFFVTNYIKNDTTNSFGIYSVFDIGKTPLYNPISEGLSLLAQSDNNEPLIIDTYPFTDPTWVQNNMVGSNANTGNLVYETKNVLKVYEPINILSNFTDIFNYSINRPVTTFTYKKFGETGLSGADYINRYFTFKLLDAQSLYPTEGYINYLNPSETFSMQTTSLLNTSYFINAMQKGIENQKSGTTYPYTQAAFLFLNSLPLASLREKYKTYENGNTTDLDYISSVFKKYGAIHKLPYAWILKLGSIWYRYKKYVQTGVDILDEVWGDFDYIKNYSPILNSSSQTYEFDYQQERTNITLKKETEFSTFMDLGFYPKIISDFNYFYNGFDLFKNYTDSEIQQAINSGMKIITDGTSQIIGVSEGDKTVFGLTKTVLIPKSDVLPVNIECNPFDNTVRADYYIIPSFGNTYNQAITELITNSNTTPQTTTDITTDPAVYNGSVRLFWAVSQFGYFDAQGFVKPSYDEYLNHYDSTSEPVPFRLLSENRYSKIEEVFSVFEKGILDSFENEFLNFTKASINSGGGPEIVEFDKSLVDMTANFKNFQGLFRSLMAVPPQKTNEPDTEYLENTIKIQLEVFGNNLKSFLDYDVLFKYGNPSAYNRRVFDSFLSHMSTTNYVVDPIQFNPYIQGTLPSKTSPVFISTSKNLNPEAWEALLLEVGFSTINGLVYTANGSYITDFFIDNNIEFNVDNVVLLSPLIKMYATQKLKSSNITTAGFKNEIISYLENTTRLQNLFLDGVFRELNKILPDQQQLSERTIQSVVDKEQSKVEIYETFKALNDKWIAGGDYSDKTLFEDILFLDRASRNVGDVLLVDIFDIKNFLNKNSLNEKMSVMVFISEILIRNNFTVMNLPSYVNFYNVQDVSINSVPKPEGSLQFANNMWGTFLNVDYRNSTSKMVCFFVGKPSEYLDIQNTDYRFRNDGFELNRSDCPLIENQQGKTDWALSNKCVGFNVDIGIRNQNVFSSFNVSQDPGKATSEAFTVLLDMINQANGKNTATQNVGMYNYYKSRSYQCKVECLGNAMIQPVMYFNLRHVPMFNGPYMIMDVSHTIAPGSFTTSFTGVRQGIYDLPSIDSFLQQINLNLLTKLQEIIVTAKDEPAVPAETENQKSEQKTNTKPNTKAPQNSCSAKLNSYYANQVGGEAYTTKDAELTRLTPQQFADILKTKLPDDNLLSFIIYCICYVETFEKDSSTNIGAFNAFDNNLARINLETNLSPSDTYFSKTYSCVYTNTNQSTPIVNFSSVEKFTDFMISRLQPNVSRILSLSLMKYYVCYWPVDGVDPEFFDSNPQNYYLLGYSFGQAEKSAREVGIIDDNTTFQVPIQTPPSPTPSLSLGISINISIEASGGCPPPVIILFSPLSGTSGQIMQINGYDLLSTSAVTINNIGVDKSLIQIISDDIIRVTIPELIDPSQTVGKIVVETKFGKASSVKDFTYI